VATFALVHGAWHGAWCWERLVPELEARGHGAIAVDLPCDDPEMGCAAYAERAAAALAGAGDDLVLVGHSMGGLTIPLVAAARPARLLVFLCALLPRPGASLIDQLRSGEEIFVPGFGASLARDDLGRSHWPDEAALIATLYQDCDPADAARAYARLRPQGRPPNVEPCLLEALPAVPCASILARDDRSIAPAWSRRAARERLGVEALELEGGHSPFLSRPAELADLLTRLAALSGGEGGRAPASGRLRGRRAGRFES
jgi:pimeloyl-ACP methyl ester carboxylesterase